MWKWIVLTWCLGGVVYAYGRWKHHKECEGMGLMVLWLLPAGLFIRSSLLDVMRSQGPSMTPTLPEKGLVMVNRAAFGWQAPVLSMINPGREPWREEIVVVEPPNQDEHYLIKRMVGLPGETIAWNAQALWINGRLARQFTPHPGMPTSQVVLGSGEYFVLGDHWQNSVDSRVFGPIRRFRLIGSVLWVKSEEWKPLAGVPVVEP